MSDRQQLIDTLSADLVPVQPVRGSDRGALLWLLLSAGWVVGMIHLLGPVRPGVWQQLLEHPRFLAETLGGVAAIGLVALAGFRAAVPGSLSRRFARAGLAALLLWLGCYVIGLASPALEPSMLGKRDQCVFEALLLGLPPIAVAFPLARRLYPLQPVRTALFLSLAAGMMPALYMQIACMYDPSHILKFHILPGLLAAFAGVAAARLLPRALRPQRAASRSR